MLLLTNLNTYLGGGEVLLVRLANEIYKRDIDVGVLCMHDSYIYSEIKKTDIPIFIWPSNNDSVVYMNRQEKACVIDSIRETFSNYENLKIFTFCLRDAYNVNVLFHGIANVELFAGIFHPLDYKYLSKLSFNAKRIVKCNRNLLAAYQNNNSLIAMNSMNFKSCLPDYEISCCKLIPLPIPNRAIDNTIHRDINPQKYKILWIGRFVDFKALGIINILKYAKKHKESFLSLVGYGPYEKKIRNYIKKNNISNIEVCSPVDNDKIQELVSGYDIGFATGTSVIEIAQCGIPSIISPMLGEKCANKYENRCAGIFSDEKNYSVGEVLPGEEKSMPYLDACMQNIIENYGEYCDKTREYIKQFEMDSVIEKYLKLFSNKGMETGGIDVPKVGIMKKLFKRSMMKFKGRK